MDTLSERLKKLECPFNWNLETLAEWNLRNKLLHKLSTDNKKDQTMEEPGGDMIDDTVDTVFDGSTTWQKCSQYSTMAWLDHRKTNGEEYMVKMENFIDDVETKIPFIARYVKALKYVITAMWAHVYYEKTELERVEACLESIATSFEDMPDTDKAAIKALKSCVLMEFGPAGHVSGALEAIKEALSLVNDEAEWHFLKGKCLGRERRARDYKSYPSDEELLHLRKAVEMDENTASYCAHCGLSVKDYASRSPHARSDAELRQTLETECEELMTKAARLNDDSPSILSRIAKGLMPLRSSSASELIKRCVLRSLELLPDGGLVNHVAGNFYMFREHDNERAMFHLNKAALDRDVFGAYVNLIDIKWRTSSDNIDPLVESFWQKFRDSAYDRIKALPVMANYYFFVKNNLVEAISFWREWMRSGNNFAETSLFVHCDMTKTLVGQIQYELRSNPALSSDNEADFRSFMEEMVEAKDLNITRTDTNRERVIRAALDKLNNYTRAIVEPKLPLRHWGTSNRSFNNRRQPTSTTRELPQNWRQ